MAFASQPIAVNASKQAQEFCTGFTSFSPRNLFTGSPMSLRTGSFQNRFYPGGSPGQSLGPIAMPDFKRSLASSWDNDAGAWIKAVKNSDVSLQEDDLCRNYVCCGVALPDLHALVDHFESCHVEVLSSPYDDFSLSPCDDSQGGTPAFDADDMEISEPSPSPPATPSPIMQASAFDPIRIVSTNSVSDGRNMSGLFRAPHQFHSSYSSLAGANGQSSAPSAFNRYAGYSDYSSNLPGTDPSPIYADAQKENRDIVVTGRCVPPALLFSSSASPSPLNTPGSSRTSSPVLSAAPVYAVQSTHTASPTSSQGLHTVPSGTLSLHPATTGSSGPSSASTSAPPYRAPRLSSNASLTLTKPFRCPKPGCNKSYKQQNGLKYHLSHGQCNFAPRDPEVEKLSEVERDKRLRPFVCKVGTECNRRYKNMNGLRYHYTHTGEHGAIGLEMLSQGRHPLPDVPNSTRSSPKAQSPQAQTSSEQFPCAGYYPNQQQLAPPVVSTPQPTAVSTVPVPAPVSLVVPPPSQPNAHAQIHSPAPSPLNPFPANGHGWLADNLVR